jgi:hypothetical protein
MTISTSGALFDSRSQNITPEIRKAAKIAAAYADFRLRARSPVRTGQLRGAWKVRLVGNGLNLTNDTPYAVYNEFGTKRMAARPMAAPTLPEAQAVFKGELARLIGQKLAGKAINGVQNGRIPSPVRNQKNAAIFNALTNGAAKAGKRGFRGLKPGTISYKQIKKLERTFGKARPDPIGKLQSRLAAKVGAIARSAQ